MAKKLKKPKADKLNDAAEASAVTIPIPREWRGNQVPQYQAGYPAMAEKLCMLGAMDPDLADFFKTTTRSIQYWQAIYPEFAAAVRAGKSDYFDPKVERSLAQKAIGYAVDTEEVRVLSNGRIIRVPIRKYFPPDTTACIFWLKNRQPARWRDVWEHRHVGALELDTKSVEQMREEILREITELGIISIVANGDGTGAVGVVGANGANGKIKH